jgi:hypothetical protein
MQKIIGNTSGIDAFMEEKNITPLEQRDIK